MRLGKYICKPSKKFVKQRFYGKSRQKTFIFHILINSYNINVMVDLHIVFIVIIMVLNKGFSCVVNTRATAFILENYITCHIIEKIISQIGHTGATDPTHPASTLHRGTEVISSTCLV